LFVISFVARGRGALVTVLVNGFLLRSVPHSSRGRRVVLALGLWGLLFRDGLLVRIDRPMRRRRPAGGDFAETPCGSFRDAMRVLHACLTTLRPGAVGADAVCCVRGSTNSATGSRTASRSVAVLDPAGTRYLHSLAIRGSFFLAPRSPPLLCPACLRALCSCLISISSASAVQTALVRLAVGGITAGARSRSSPSRSFSNNRRFATGHPRRSSRHLRLRRRVVDALASVCVGLVVRGAVARGAVALTPWPDSRRPTAPLFVPRGCVHRATCSSPDSLRPNRAGRSLSPPRYHSAARPSPIYPAAA